MQGHELWLSLSYEDMLAARSLLKDKLYNTAAYHCQQSAEKALKAYLAFKCISVPKMHNLVKLNQLCSMHQKEFSILINQVSMLTPFDTATRYPDDLIEVSALDIKQLVNAAQKVLDFVVQSIEKSTGHHQIILFPRVTADD